MRISLIVDAKARFAALVKIKPEPGPMYVDFIPCNVDYSLTSIDCTIFVLKSQYLPEKFNKVFIFYIQTLLDRRCFLWYNANS